MPFPDALKGNPKIIFFTDFDGTITMKDCNDWLTDNFGFGQELRKKENLDTLEGRNNFRDSFQIMVESVSARKAFPECVKALTENITLDPYFKEFYTWARQAGIPVVVLSSGMVPIIRAILTHLVGPEAADIEIICNDIEDVPPKTRDEVGGWKVVFHDDSVFGHDKSLALRPYAEHRSKSPSSEQYTMLYAGDGVSDLSAARETDLLFAKAGHDLITFCEREGIAFTVFESWKDIWETTKDIFEGKVSVKKIAAESLNEVKKDPSKAGRN